jgi:small-conductance mechanosensitive channel
MKDGSTHHHGPLAGLGAGAAAVLLAAVVLLLAWHRVAAQVAAGITVLVYVVITVVCGLAVSALAYAVLWLRHRVRHPETLAPRQQVRAEVLAAESPQVIAARPPAAIEPPRVYLNVTDDQLAALMRQQVTDTQLPRGNRDQRPA